MNEIDSEGIPTPYHNMWLGPSVSPIFNNNPGFSVITIDDESLVTVDIEAYYFDLEATYNSTKDELSLI